MAKILKKGDAVRFRHNGQVFDGRVAQLSGQYVQICHARGLTQVSRDAIVQESFGDVLGDIFGGFNGKK